MCVDWGKELRKRRAWVADVANRSVRKLEGESWTLANVLAAARRFESHVVVSIDAVLGVPTGYLERLRASAAAWCDADGFLPWLRRAAETPGFFTESHDATDWRYDRPFIAVPRGKGSLDAFWARASGPLLRGVERATGAKSAFIVSGISGTVGSGTRALWQELAPLFRPVRDFGVWPFEGPLATLFERHRIVLAEIYPCVCYALALDDKLPAPLRIVAKTKAGPREDATRCLLRAPWLAMRGATILGADPSRIDEDDFDAMVSAAGLLRCVLEGHPLERPGTDGVEGDILGFASLDLSRRLTRGCRDDAPSLPRKPTGITGGGTRDYPCPIDGCPHVFHGSRGGWDSHVAKFTNHADWHPEICDGLGRKAAFHLEFPHWFH
jgi:hypothetical protein